jgi:hypothetical protein
VTPRIVFNFLNCPTCKKSINADHCPAVSALIGDIKKIEKIVSEKAI